LLGDPSLQPIKATAHAFARTNAVERVTRGGTFQPETRAFRRERLVRTGSNLSRTLGTAVPTKTRVPSGVRKPRRPEANQHRLEDEHDAAVLIAENSEFKLRLRGGHPCADPHIRALVGKRIRAEGFVSAGQFIIERYEVLGVD
jgi:hypothetical protein